MRKKNSYEIFVGGLYKNGCGDYYKSGDTYFNIKEANRAFSKVVAYEKRTTKDWCDNVAVVEIAIVKNDNWGELLKVKRIEVK